MNTSSVKDQRHAFNYGPHSFAEKRAFYVNCIYAKHIGRVED